MDSKNKKYLSRLTDEMFQNHNDHNTYEEGTYHKFPKMVRQLNFLNQGEESANRWDNENTFANIFSNFNVPLPAIPPQGL